MQRIEIDEDALADIDGIYDDMSPVRTVLRLTF